ncbi:hypothetical protein PUN4_730024 [Paraburkholderia unamae]|nr:hypothetical protein PUN4_730024 [Paraburkholderia unamae]
MNAKRADLPRARSETKGEGFGPVPASRP